MKLVEIQVRESIKRTELEVAMGKWAGKNDAELRPMGRLVRAYKTEGENLHWHIAGRQKGMGTVEVSYFPSNGILKVLVHDNRVGSWAGEAHRGLAEELKRLFSSSD